MRSKRRFVLAVLFVLLAASATGVMAQKVKPSPPPPPAPFVLDAGLNIVTSEVSARMRVLAPSQNPPVIWTGNDITATAFTLADYDGDHLSEMVIGAVCNAGTKRVPQNRVFLKTYEQGALEPVSWSCLEASFPTSSAAATSSQLLAYDLDGDAGDEIVAAIGSAVGVFHWNGISFEVSRTVDLGLLAANVGAPTPLQRRSLAIGDVDGDGLPEIVTAGSYRNDARQDKEYLLVFDSGLQLKGVTPFFDKGEGQDLSDFSIAYRDGMAIGDTDGDGVNEIWVSGWTNHFDIMRYEQKVLAWKVDYYDYSTQPAGLVLTQAAAENFGLSDNLGPDIALGGLLPDAPAHIALTHLDDTSFVKVFRRAGNLLEIVASKSYPEPERVSLHAPRIIDNKLVAVGTLPSTGKNVLRGVAADLLTLQCGDGACTLTSQWSTSAREGYELWGYEVGFGIR